MSERHYTMTRTYLEVSLHCCGEKQYFPTVEYQNYRLLAWYYSNLGILSRTHLVRPILRLFVPLNNFRCSEEARAVHQHAIEKPSQPSFLPRIPTRSFPDSCNGKNQVNMAPPTSEAASPIGIANVSFLPYASQLRMPWS